LPNDSISLYCWPDSRNITGPPGNSTESHRKGTLPKTEEVQNERFSGRPVAIVGGSAAGFFAASLLARAGKPVVVFERSERLDPAPRTLIVTHRMRELLGRVADRSVVNEIRRFELFTDGRSATIPLAKPDLIVERGELIRGLSEEATGYGAKIELGRRFTSLDPAKRGLALTVQNAEGTKRDRVHAEAVIGADGAQSSVAHAAGWPKQATTPLVQAIVKLPAGMPPDTVRVWFIPDDTPFFYWLIPESPDRGVLGLIGVDGHETRRSLERFMEKRHFAPQSFQGGRTPVYNRWVPVQRKIGEGNVYLVGDAAGQVKVSTIGGIVAGFRGALGVCESILHGGQSNELRALRRELDLHLLIRRSIHHFKQSDYSRLVDWMNDEMRRSLSRVTRDEAARVLWNICRSQPRLLLVGLRGLLTRNPLDPRNQY
jgi:flavin-dependent dehydrogenase